MSRTLGRSLVLAAATCLLLTSCGGSDDGRSSSDGGSEADTKSVSAVGLTFEVPSDYTEIGANDLAGDSGEDSPYADVSERMGMTPEQFEQTLQAVDLFVFDDEESADGFVDNVNVLEQPGTVPEDAQIEEQFGQIGAEVTDVRHTDTDPGEVVEVDYTLDLEGSEVTGRSILLEADDQVVNITVSSAEADTAEEIADRVVESLS